MSRAIIIFVRNPEKGKVKTRLAATMGEDSALDIYLQLLRHTAAVAKGLKDVRRYVFYSDEIRHGDLWNGDDFQKMLQDEGDLGRKIYAAFEQVFAAGHDKVLIIGSDCPGLTIGGLERAFEALSLHDAVIGPANDGGYYLLGLRELRKEFFSNKEWSTESVYQATIHDFEALRLTHHNLPELIDIDTEEDWKAAGSNVLY